MNGYDYDNEDAEPNNVRSFHRLFTQSGKTLCGITVSFDVF